MPRSGRRVNSRLTTDHKQADVTLDDFANSKVSASRLRKPTCNSLVREVKQLCIDGEDSSSQNDLDEETELQEQPESSKGKEVKLKKELFNLGVEYPLDLWFILAQYIVPEDVQVFASICKSSLHVVKTFQFWIGLYKRYYSSSAHLPERLLPDHIKKAWCLRACVIRSLYHMYPPFARRAARTPLDEEIYSLVPLKCVSVWHTNNNNKWCFFFKFQSSHAFGDKPTKPFISKTCETWLDNSDYDSISLVQNVNANPEDGCRVLCISGLHYAAVLPSIMGSRLADVKVMMKDAHHHVVQLSFATNGYQCSPRRKLALGKGGGDVVLLDCVESLHVFHWWHPKYPLCHNF